MRPVDADALLEAIEKERQYLLARGQAGAEYILVHNFRKLVEDASSVPLPDFKEGYRQAIIDGKTNYSRPRGKWIAREDMDYIDENKVVHKHFECTECGLIHDFIDGHTTQYSFCPNCGADMRGEK